MGLAPRHERRTGGADGACTGLLAGPLGALIAGSSAGVIVYGAGPVVAVLERRRFRHRTATHRQVRRHWGALAIVGALGVSLLISNGGWNGDAPAAAIGMAVFATVIGLPIALVATVVAVDGGARLPPRFGRPVAVLVPTALSTAIVWELLSVAGHGLTVVDGALALATVVVVPLTVPLVLADHLPGRRTAAALVSLLAGGWAAVALLTGRGLVAAALALPWTSVTVALAVVLLVRTWRHRTPAHVVVTLAAGYLAVGALWLLADRAGLEPVGVGAPFVQLTAVHFTYAGFVATVLAWRAWQRRPSDRAVVIAVVAVAAAPPLVAAGFVAYAPLQIVGAALLTVGTYAYAWVVLRRIVPILTGSAHWLLGASAVSVLVPMLLAVQWAVGANLGTAALSVPAMAATHGVANALGFSLLGVLGWHRVASTGTSRAQGDHVSDASTETRQRLRDAAIATVRERGIAGVSARTVAANAGVNQASIYYHFGSLDALLSEAARDATAGRVSAHRERLAAVTSVDELVVVARQLHAEEREFGNVAVLAQMLAGARNDPALAVGTTAALQLWIDEVATTLQRLLDDTVLEELVDVPALARGVSAAFIGVELLDGAGRSDDEPDVPTLDALAQLAELLQVVLDLGPVASAALRRLHRGTRR